MHSVDTGDRILAAAASCVVDFGVDRVTLAEIARRAGVSRPTVYRRWPDTRSIMSALLTRHITDVMRDVPLLGDDREALVQTDGRGGRPVASRRTGHVGDALASWPGSTSPSAWAPASSS